MEREGGEPNQAENPPNPGKKVKDYFFYRSIEYLRTSSSTREEREIAMGKIISRKQALRLCRGEYPYLTNLMLLARVAGLSFRNDKIKEIATVTQVHGYLLESFSNTSKSNTTFTYVIPTADKEEVSQFLQTAEDLSRFRH